jgi:hypothetical protein
VFIFTKYVHFISYFITASEHTYLLTAWSRVLLEKLTGFAAIQEIPHILWNPSLAAKCKPENGHQVTKFTSSAVNTDWSEPSFQQ